MSNISKKIKKIKNFDAEYPVLIVESNVKISNYIYDFLSLELGCDIDVAKSYADAEKFLEVKKYAFAISSLNLSDDTAGNIGRLLRVKGVNFCIISSSVGEELRTFVYTLGAIDYFLINSNGWLNDIVMLIKRLNRNSKMSALVVDSNQIQRLILASKIRKLNLNVIEAESGVQALKKLQENPDTPLVLTNFDLSDMDGELLTIKIRANHQKDDMAIIGMSSLNFFENDSRIVSKFIKAGANDCLHKQVSNEEFLCKINQTLDFLELIRSHKEKSIKDFLTGLYNRRHFFTEGNVVYKKQKGNVSLAILDIDFFKKINDTYGHDGGDETLITIASILHEQFNKQILARIGGEEFAVLFKCNLEEARIQMEKFRKTVEETILVVKKKKFNMTISVGIATLDDDITSLNDLYQMADLKLYDAKKNGRNQVVI
jgi:diguanylate cyclase (GGDEF)-like protein